MVVQAHLCQGKGPCALQMRRKNNCSECRRTGTLEEHMLVIILSVLTIFAATLVILQFHITSFGVPDLLFDIVSALSSCGVTTGYVAYNAADLEVGLHTRDVDRRLEVIPVIILFMGLFRDGTERIP